jgi:hypothetical protein
MPSGKVINMNLNIKTVCKNQKEYTIQMPHDVHGITLSIHALDPVLLELPIPIPEPGNNVVITISLADD